MQPNEYSIADNGKILFSFLSIFISFLTMKNNYR